MTNAELDAIKAALLANGSEEHSVYLLTHRNERKAKCPPCNVWFALSEIQTSNGCPKCGQQGDFEIPDSYAGEIAG